MVVKPASDVGYAMVQEGVKLAKTYFKPINLPFFEFLETKSVTETHDIADASLFVLMTLEESRWYCAGFRFCVRFDIACARYTLMIRDLVTHLTGVFPRRLAQ